MNNCDFFGTEPVAEGVTAIIGLGAELCYLVEGTERALLIDTLTGVGNLKAFCETLTDKPIMVVNTHGHLDHCGGNPDFRICYIHPDDIEMMYGHIQLERRMWYLSSQQAMQENPIPFTEDDMPKPSALFTLPVNDGDVFDLGDRRLEVIAVPGHSRGSLVLLDEKTRIVFSGDACNSNTLLSLDGSTTIETYRESLLHFQTYLDRFDVLHGGHGLQAVDKRIIGEAITLCEEILAGEDDQVEREFLGRTFVYAKRTEDSRRPDGKLPNIAYRRDAIFSPGQKPVRVISGDAMVFKH